MKHKLYEGDPVYFIKETFYNKKPDIRVGTLGHMGPWDANIFYTDNGQKLLITRPYNQIQPIMGRKNVI